MRDGEAEREEESYVMNGGERMRGKGSAENALLYVLQAKVKTRYL